MNTQNRGYPLLGGDAASNVGDDLAAIKDAFVAIDADVQTLITDKADHTEVTNAVDALRDGVASEGDTFAKLYALVSNLQTLFNSDDATLDTLQEVVTYIKSEKSVLDSVTTTKVNVADIVNTLVSNATDKPLSAAQGAALKTLLDTLQTAVTDKVDTAAMNLAIATAVAGGVGLDLTKSITTTGELQVLTGKVRWYPTKNVNILALQACVDTPSVGANIVAVLKKNGVVVGTVTILAGQNKSTLVLLDNVTGTTNDYFTADITQVGTSTKGSDLVITVTWEYAS